MTFWSACDIPASAVPGDVIENCSAVAAPTGHVETDASDNGSTAGPAGSPWCATVTVGEYLPDANMVATTKVFTNPPGVPGGGPLTFEITVRNDGPAPAEGVTLTDLFFGLDSITVLGMETPPVGNWICSTGLTCHRANPMPAGLSETLTLSVLLPPDAHLRNFGAPLTGNVAVVTADNPDPDISPLSNLVYAPVPIDPQVDLSIEKTLLSGGDGNVAPGGSAIFELVVRNDGPSDADGAVVTDAILSGPGTVAVISPDAGDLYIPAGQTRDILVRVDIATSAVPGDTVVNCSAVAHTDETDASDNGSTAGPAGSAWCAAVTVGDYLPPADVSVSKTFTNAPGVPGGGAMSFQLEVTNNGPAPAEGVTVVDALSGLFGYHYGGFEVALPIDWFCGSGGTCTRRDPMPAGLTETITFFVTLPPDAHVHSVGAGLNTAVVTADNPETTGGFFAELFARLNSISAVGVPIEPQVDLSMEKVLINGGVGNVSPGGVALFELVVRNDGPSDADGATVTDAILSGPLGTTATIVSPDAGDLYIPAGQTRDLLVRVDIPASAVPGDVIENCAAVAEPTGHVETDASDNGSTAGPSGSPWCASVTVGKLPARRRHRRVDDRHRHRPGTWSRSGRRRAPTTPSRSRSRTTARRQPRA